jgi:hypothetical protein
MRALNAMKESLWRAVEWSFVTAALCCLFARAWTDPSLSCGTQRRMAKRNDTSVQQRTSPAGSATRK